MAKYNPAVRRRKKNHPNNQPTNQPTDRTTERQTDRPNYQQWNNFTTTPIHVNICRILYNEKITCWNINDP